MREWPRMGRRAATSRPLSRRICWRSRAAAGAAIAPRMPARLQTRRHHPPERLLHSPATLGSFRPAPPFVLRDPLFDLDGEHVVVELGGLAGKLDRSSCTTSGASGTACQFAPLRNTRARPRIRSKVDPRGRSQDFGPPKAGAFHEDDRWALVRTGRPLEGFESSSTLGRYTSALRFLRPTLVRCGIYLDQVLRDRPGEE